MAELESQTEEAQFTLQTETQPEKQKFEIQEPDESPVKAFPTKSDVASLAFPNSPTGSATNSPVVFSTHRKPSVIQVTSRFDTY